MIDGSEKPFEFQSSHDVENRDKLTFLLIYHQELNCILGETNCNGENDNDEKQGFFSMVYIVSYCHLH